MLKGIPPILSPDLMKTILEMGHGDEPVLLMAISRRSVVPKDW